MRRALAVFAVMAAVAGGKLAHACFIHSPLPVELVEDEITIDIVDNIAIKQYTCTFFNPNQQAVVGGTCYMEFEADAQIDKLTLRLDDKEVEAEMIDAEKAKKVFQEIVAKGGSPALLEFYGKGLIRAEVPKIPPQGKVVAVLRYTQVIRNENGVFRMGFLNTNPKAWLKPLKRVVVNCKLKTTQPLKSIYSPTHPVKVTRIDDHNATIFYEQANYLPKTPMALYWHVAEGSVGVSALTYRDEEERGYFMMMVSPTIDPASVPVVPQEIIFCLDSSGSMVEDNRLGQLQAALKYCLGKMNAGDKFNIVDFGTEARAFKEELLPATPENIQRAIAHVEKMKARGRTAIEEAVTLSLGQFTDAAVPKSLIFLTDGLPNEGEQDTDKLADIVTKRNRRGARIFTFGVGNEINTRLLDMMALDNGGTSAYVLPSESLESRIVEFYDRIANPVLTDVAIRFQDVKVEELFPKRLPDLFKGQQIVLFGRYFVESEGWSAKREVLITGRLGGKEVAFTYKLEFPETEAGHEFLPRVWAGRKVAHLMDEIKRNGKKEELVDEVVRLAKQYAIVTPYTSFLVTDDHTPGAPGFAAMKRAAKESFGAGGGTFLGAGEMEKAQALNELRDSAAPASMDYAGRSSGKTELQVMEKLRMIGTKSFYLKDGVWYDSVYDPEKHKDVTTLKLASDEYVKLVEAKPGLAKYLSLSQVVVVYQGKTYRVEP